MKTKHGALIPVLASELDVFVSMSVQDNSWDYWVFRAMNFLTPGGGVAYDIGANIGYLSVELAWSRRDDAVQVYSFEPQPALAASITKAKDINDLENLEVFQLALSDSIGIGTFGLRAHSVHGSMDLGVEPVHRIHSRFEVETTTIDSLVRGEQIRPPDLIKIDVEGFEFSVLRGARQTIQTYQPFVIFELSIATFEYGFTPKHCFKLIREQGDYLFCGIKGGELQAESLSFDKSEHYDVVAVPLGRIKEFEEFLLAFNFPPLKGNRH